MMSRIPQTFLGVLVLVAASAASHAQKPKLYLQTGHSKEISNMEFSPDGKLFASIDKHHKGVKLWEVQSGREIRTLSGHVKGTFEVVFITNKTLITCGPDGNDDESGSIKV